MVLGEFLAKVTETGKLPWIRIKKEDTVSVQKATIYVRGMHCAGCAKLVEKALKATPGVSAAKVDLTSAHRPSAGSDSPRSLTARGAEP